jgi:thioredoxin reductase (NADPH)
MKEITAAEFDREVLEGGKVVLDFYSTECPPCEALAPKYEAMAALYGDHIRFLKIFRQGNRELATRLGVSSSPTVLFFDQGKIAAEPISGGIRKAQLMERLDSMLPLDVAEGLRAQRPRTVSNYEVVVLGGGPAGLTAALYLGQAKTSTLLIDTALPGGYMGITHQVSNYPGFVDPQPGYLLAHFMAEQAKHTGIDTRFAVDVTSVDLQAKTLVLDETETVHFQKIILAMGTTPNTTNAPGEKELRGKGISYCATCDAKYFEGKEVTVIGGGNSAVEEALFIAKFASKITLVHQFAALTANQTAIDRLLQEPKISVVYESEPRRFEKEGDQMHTTIEHLPTGKTHVLTSDGVFVFIGFKANLSLLGNTLPELDDWGYLRTDDDRRTSLPGVFAAGDIVSKRYRQITTAVADGTIAGIAASK